MYIINSKNKFEIISANRDEVYNISALQRIKMKELFGEKITNKLLYGKCITYNIDNDVFYLWNDYWPEMEEVDIYVEAESTAEQIALRINRNGELVEIHECTEKEKSDYDFTIIRSPFISKFKRR